MGMVEKKSEMIGKIRQSWVIVGLLMARLTVNNCWYGFGKYWRIITLIRNLEKIRVCLLRFFAPFAYIFVFYCLLIFLFLIVETKILINKSNIKCFKKKKKKKKEVFTSEMTETQPATHKGTIMQQSVKWKCCTK
jgi:hypothetical protein